MITRGYILYLVVLLNIILFLSFEKIKLSWEISTLYNNNENLLVEFENLKDLNLKLVTQFHLSLIHISEPTRPY